MTRVWTLLAAVMLAAPVMAQDAPAEAETDAAPMSEAAPPAKPARPADEAAQAEPAADASATETSASDSEPDRTPVENVVIMADELSGPDAFADIGDDGERSVALFNEMGKVLQHPRCLNCHPVTGGPLQGDDMHPHMPPMIRGEADFGPDAMNCNTCHGAENVPFATGEGSIPGHEPWSLAPVSMGWVGKSLGEICEQIKDPERNGGKDLEALYEHNAEDGLVGWGWEPGEGRTPAPGSQEIFGELTRAWIDTGAACPS